MAHFIYKCKHGRTTAGCKCSKEHQVKLSECKTRACIDDDIKAARHGGQRTGQEPSGS